MSIECGCDTASETTGTSAKTRVPNEKFVQAYMLCDSYSELAEELGLSDASVASRANKLRKLGVNLPKYAKAAKAIDVDALNALIVNQQ